MKSFFILSAFILSGFYVMAGHLTAHDYKKTEHYITTRDGVALYTAVYQPKNGSKKYPVLLTRTPYGSAPYGTEIPDEIMYNDLLVKEGYIFVCQDIRGRSMSDGEDMINMKPVYSQQDPNRTDEVTDAYDTIDWIVKNVSNNNGKVGLYGHSYKGWTALMAALCKHKSLKAVQSGSPCIDLYFEDFSRYGLFSLAYAPIIDWFGTPKTRREPGAWWERRTDYFSFFENYGHKLDYDSYEFFLKKGALKNFGNLLSEKNYFFKYLKEHPSYDEARKERSAVPYLKNMDCPVLIVGGWNDEQNMYGILKAFETVAANNKSVTRFIVGPWTHGDYRQNDSVMYVGNIYYGKGINQDYFKKEFDFFQAYLNDGPEDSLPTFCWFNTGSLEWMHADKEPATIMDTFYLLPGEKMAAVMPEDQNNTFFAYTSDPAKPVPYIEEDNFNLFVSKSFMTADQRFASKRPDVLTFTTEVLTEDLTLCGGIKALLKFATNRQDADLVVKLIDVLPMDRKPEATDKNGIKMNGYQQMIRCGYIRGRYRNDFSVPQPFTPETPTDVPVELLDIFHTFKKGHRIMIQVQSSLFPLFDRNPQKYVNNIFEAEDSDFTKAEHKVYAGSKIVFHVLSR